MGNLKVSVARGDEALALIGTRMGRGERTRLFFLNAHCYTVAQRDGCYRRHLNAAELVLNDGVGIGLGGRLFGFDFPENLNGTDYIPRLLGRAASRGWTVYLLGGMPGVAEKAGEELKRAFPGLCIVGTHHGYFSDSDAMVREVNLAAPDILIAGLGVPLQENWTSEQIERLDVRLVVCGGAFLDFAAGRLPRAPLILRRARLEWLFRLTREPRRLWRRYLLGNVLFFYYLARNRLRPLP